jgi:hypothetical protein
MTEEILPSTESEFNTEDFVRHTEMKVRAILEQCQRKSIQPRDLLQKAFEDKKRVDDFAQNLYETAFVKLSSMPNYNLNDHVEYVRAKKDIMNIITPFVDTEECGHDVPTQDMKENWVNVGVFSYEFGLDREVILHVPPMKNNPGLHQLKESLHTIAGIIKNDINIREVRGSSLLLEHPLAKHLGFKIDEESDGGVSPNFKMSREEFLERWGK